MGLCHSINEIVPPGQSSYTTKTSPSRYDFTLINFLLSVSFQAREATRLDLFLWPFLQELLCLAWEVHSFNALESTLFTLCAQLTNVFGNILAMIYGHVDERTQWCFFMLHVWDPGPTSAWSARDNTIFLCIAHISSQHPKGWLWWMHKKIKYFQPSFVHTQ